MKMNKKKEEKSYGAGSRKPSTGDVMCERAGHPSSRSSNRNVTKVDSIHDWAIVTDTTTSLTKPGLTSTSTSTITETAGFKPGLWPNKNEGEGFKAKSLKHLNQSKLLIKSVGQLTGDLGK